LARAFSRGKTATFGHPRLLSPSRISRSQLPAAGSNRLHPQGTRLAPHARLPPASRRHSDEALSRPVGRKNIAIVQGGSLCSVPLRSAIGKAQHSAPGLKYQKPRRARLSRTQACNVMPTLAASTIAAMNHAPCPLSYTLVRGWSKLTHQIASAPLATIN